jgi:hypothetical protein
MVLGSATVYTSARGVTVEIVHDTRAGVAIVRLPNGETVVLPEEIAGIEGRYRNNHMTVWEMDGDVVLWIDGSVAFNGSGMRQDPR